MELGAKSIGLDVVVIGSNSALNILLLIPPFQSRLIRRVRSRL